MLPVLILFASISWTLAECPAKEVSQPCGCDNIHRQIFCSRGSGSDLKSTFQRTSASIKDKSFKRLIISRVSSADIPADVTANLVFESIEIGHDTTNDKLVKIHSDAFRGTASRVKELVVNSYNRNLQSASAPYNIFDLINSLENIEKLDFQAPKVSKIPRGAFKLLNKLQFLKFGRAKNSDGRMSIGDEAFSQLKNLKALSLTSSKLNWLSKDALHFASSSVALDMDLDQNELNVSSFASGSLTKFNRPTRINLMENKLQALPKTIFKQFLDANRNNQITDLRYNPLNCSDCRNKWLVDGKSKYKNQVLNAYCGGRTNGPTVFDQKFGHCKDN